MVTHVLLALIYVQNSITMPHLAVIQLMRVSKWSRTDSDGRRDGRVNKNVRGNKGFYSISAARHFIHSTGKKVPVTIYTVYRRYFRAGYRYPHGTGVDPYTLAFPLSPPLCYNKDGN